MRKPVSVSHDLLSLPRCAALLALMRAAQRDVHRKIKTTAAVVALRIDDLFHHYASDFIGVHLHGSPGLQHHSVVGAFENIWLAWVYLASNASDNPVAGLSGHVAF